MSSINYSRLKIGDTFVGKINSSKYPNYNGFSLILHVVDKYVQDGYIHIIVVNYLVNDCDKNIDLITEDNCICTFVKTMQDRFYPINGLIPIEEHLKNVASIPVYPDEDGRLYQYNVNIMFEEEHYDLFSDDLEYIGNYSLPVPKNNFRPVLDENEWVFYPNAQTQTFNIFVDEMIECYQRNNLKQSDIFKKEILENIIFSKIQGLKEEIKFDRRIRELAAQGKLDEFIELKKNPNTEVDSETGDTLTYVGGDSCK